MMLIKIIKMTGQLLKRNLESAAVSIFSIALVWLGRIDLGAGGTGFIA